MTGGAVGGPREEGEKTKKKAHFFRFFLSHELPLSLFISLRAAFSLSDSLPPGKEVNIYICDKSIVGTKNNNSVSGGKSKKRTQKKSFAFCFAFCCCEKAPAASLFLSLPLFPPSPLF